MSDKWWGVKEWTMLVLLKSNLKKNRFFSFNIVDTDDPKKCNIIPDSIWYTDKSTILKSVQLEIHAWIGFLTNKFYYFGISWDVNAIAC